MASVLRRVSVSSEQSFAKDDENDTLLFERWAAHVVEKYPNPERIGCPSHEVLESFVNKPASVALADLNDTHITRCRECTLALRELRRLREEKLKKAASPRYLEFWMSWRVPAAAGICITLVIAVMAWRHLQGIPQLGSTVNETAVAMTIDLSADGVKRSPGAETEVSLFALPRRIVDLDLVFPYFSPGGDYDFTIVRGKDEEALETRHTRAAADGPYTRARFRLDLRYLSPGRYYLGAARTGESPQYLYPFTLN